MKKILIILAITIISLTGCKEKSSSPKEIKGKILEYRTEISNLNKKIDKLYAQLGEDTNINTNDLKVDVLVVQKQSFKHFVEVTGNVDAINNSQISPQMNGQITKIYVIEGQKVSRGQLLVKLNDEVLRKNLAQLETSLLLADTMYQKQKKLFAQKVISEVQYLQAKNQKETLEKNIDVINSQLALSVIRAPFSGIVDQIFVKEGEISMPGQPVIQLVNLSEMEVTADIPENYLPKINIGDKIKLSFQTYPDVIIESKISFKGNVINPVNRTFRIKTKFKNPGQKIKPNMLAIIHFNDYSSAKAIVVPSEILAKDVTGWFLYVVNEDDNKTIARKRYVNIGVSDIEKTIINSGLKENEQVITKGFNLVKDGLKISVNN